MNYKKTIILNLIEKINKNYKIDIQAIVTCDSDLEIAKMKDYAEFDKKVDLVVLRPLLLLPEELKKGYLKLLN